MNADDFGLTGGVNRGIIEAHQRGIVTSTTLMANSAGFENAVTLAQANPKLSVGCHVMVVDGTPVLPPSKISTLAEGQSFRRDLSSFALRALLGKINMDEIEAEATAQIRKLQSAGIAVSHIDTHKHTHMFPRVLKPLLQAATKCGVRAIRNPFGRMVFPFVAKRPALWKRYSQITLLNGWRSQFLAAVATAGMITTDGSLGVVATGSLDDSLMRFTLETIPEGTWELVTHPGYNDAALEGIHTRLRESRDVEREILCSLETWRQVQGKRVALISYGELAA